MKKNKFVGALFISILVLLVQQAVNNSANGNSFGAPVNNGRGYTGSPSDNRACNVTGCHNGTLNAGPGLVEITSTIPIDGYKAGERYSVTAKITQSGRTKFGFQITAEDNSNQKVGRFLAGSETRAPSDFFVTQGTSGASSSGSGSKSWTFNWDAPSESGNGTITFYAAFNGANNNGSSSGDNIYTTSLTSTENILSSISENKKTGFIRLFPNPADEVLHLQLMTSDFLNPLSYFIYDLQGRKVLEGNFDGAEIQFTPELNISKLLPGVYQIILNQEELQHTSKFIKR